MLSASNFFELRRSLGHQLVIILKKSPKSRLTFLLHSPFMLVLPIVLELLHCRLLINILILGLFKIEILGLLSSVAERLLLRELFFFILIIGPDIH